MNLEPERSQAAFPVVIRGKEPAFFGDWKLAWILSFRGVIFILLLIDEPFPSPLFPLIVIIVSGIIGKADHMLSVSEKHEI